MPFYSKRSKDSFWHLLGASDALGASRRPLFVRLVYLWLLVLLPTAAYAVGEKPYIVNGSGEPIKLVQIKPNSVFSDQRVIDLWKRDLYLKGTEGFSAVIVQPGYCYIGQKPLDQSDVRLTFSSGLKSISANEARHGFDLQFKIINERSLKGELSCGGFDLIVLGND